MTYIQYMNLPRQTLRSSVENQFCVTSNHFPNMLHAFLFFRIVLSSAMSDGLAFKKNYNLILSITFEFFSIPSTQIDLECFTHCVPRNSLNTPLISLSPLPNLTPPARISGYCYTHSRVTSLHSPRFTFSLATL